MIKNCWFVCLLCLLGINQGYAYPEADSLRKEDAPPVQTEDSLMQALGNIPAFTIYKDNYIVTGTSFSGGKVNKYNSDAKFQISLRHRLYRGLLPYRIYVFLTYSQKSFWDIYQKSAPFAETNYNPTIGFGRNFIKDRRIAGIGMIQFEHESNGRDSIWSRSWNRVTFTGIYIFNKNYSLQAKVWIPMMVAKENKNIARYSGIGHVAGTYTNEENRLSCSVLMIKRGGWNFNASWQLEVAYRIFRLDNQYVFLQFYDGYGESLIDYDRFHRYVRVGFVIKPKSVSIF